MHSSAQQNCRARTRAGPNKTDTGPVSSSRELAQYRTKNQPVQTLVLFNKQSI